MQFNNHAIYEEMTVEMTMSTSSSTFIDALDLISMHLVCFVKLRLKEMTGMLVLSCLCLWHMFGVFDFQTDGVKTVSGTEGDSVTLHTGLTEVVGRDVILWTSLGYNIARFNRAAESISTLDGPDGIFKNRLRVTFLTGDLTISDLTTKHSGLYDVKIMQGSKVSYKRYKVEVHARLPIPVIASEYSLNSSSSESSSKCVLVCSVVNVTQATLSWYKGNRLLNNINASNITTDLSLPLEVEYQENNIYSCVINNPIRNQTKHLNITEVCQPCSDIIGDSTHKSKCVLVCSVFSFTEAVIRLVISGLVVMAAVAILVYDIISRRTEQKT
ncbi:hepatocyte cell adhesion molecule-like isoform X2 [Xyrauchen texanus]|uniref:hepatocyte cell adhesion molecule-like isoform X2 n=1 Tax=Xyrauchen texanus TaxID=154827 RepID=UPI0022420670|nr:hepatocyte cell adhesion molecule-like isoform X2 [Xyrauchen texanus]